MDEKNVLSELYKIVAMGIIGIDEVSGHISSKVLAKTMIDAKKKYTVYKTDIAKMINDLGDEAVDINIIIKMFNKIYTKAELITSNDSKIAKMLIEGTNKGIIKIEEILNLDLDKKVEKIAKEILDLLEYQIKSWKSYL